MNIHITVLDWELWLGSRLEVGVELGSAEMGTGGYEDGTCPLNSVKFVCIIHYTKLH